MSWSLNLRVLGACGVWLAIQTGCGGNPEVDGLDPSMNGAGTAGTGATSAGGTGGGLMFDMAGQNGDGEGGTEGQNDYVCGNQQLEPGEFCDDGNTVDGDGCSGNCTEVDLDYDCSVVGETCVKVVNCGNGILEGAELCDDSNTAAGDGCSADCNTVEGGWVCIRPGKPCVEVAVCGNGEREPGEECDDAGSTELGCDDLCQIEDNYYCPMVGQPCVLQECGNGARTPGEDCDDDNTGNGDGCSSTCDVEPGWRCGSANCQPVCGDGMVLGNEECDDGDRDSSDGCSGACTEEPFFNCTGSPSTCASSIACGNSVIEPGEICDPPGQNGCKSGCKSFDPDTVAPAVCGNSVIEDTETCDPPAVNNGCSAACAVEPNWTCPQQGVCFRNPYCGDNIVQTTEGCDPPNAGNGCSAACQVESGYICVGLGPSTCSKPVCNNGLVDTGEQCDDKNNDNSDGCSATCQIEAGYACPNAGALCIPKCGDGLKKGSEQCDDHNLVTGDGCNAGCKIEPGFKCPTPNMACTAAVCRDKVVDVGEGCDDGGTCVGGNNVGTACTADATCTNGGKCVPVAGDGCSATCQKEPPVLPGVDRTVDVKCGDGLVTGSDACDDGNSTDGDGCTKLCAVEDGWKCDPKTVLPGTLQMTVVYRDFKSASAANGHPDFMYDDLSHVAEITGGVCKYNEFDDPDAADCGRLDADGKPVLVKTGQQGSTGIKDAGSFKMWYHDGNADDYAGYFGEVNTTTIGSTLTLTQNGGNTSDVYVYDAGGNNFYPINAQGEGNIGTENIACGNNGTRNYVDDTLPAMNKGCHCDGGACINKNFGFTTELRYFFQYKGGERLTFSGDDDVWVYINGRVAVDIGGLHPQRNGQVVLGDDGNGTALEDSNCSAHSTDTAPPDPGTPAVPLCLSALERGDARDDRFDLDVGGVYEIALFHAERHVDASNFKLTLAGFLAPRSFCEPKCGDGKIVGDEACDDGALNSDTIAGRCNTTCTARAYCGDGVKQIGEDCDNGSNTDLYDTGAANLCAPGCKAPASCGDDIVQPAKEQCDNGDDNDDASYGPTSCKTTCKLGGYCGDTVKNGNEACDLGPNNGKGYGPGTCGYNCQPGPSCGDDIRNGSEECDDGTDNGTAQSHCDVTCKIKKYCGDGVKDVDAGEQCDYGQFASTAYGGCTETCMSGPACGDGNFDPPYEECDDGAANNTGGYDGCTNKCDLGPHCGDAEVQAGETCDNGFNDDVYKFDDASCGDGCIPPPFCGDGVKQADYELCDEGQNNNDATYDGCTTDCNYGPFCGDDTVDPEEVCDDGLDNVSYAPEEGGCGYDCQKAPFCGDGTRNGPEQCDMGADNTGEYGGCNQDCTFAPRCGDNVRQGSEECDEGPSGSLSCTPTCKRRVVVQ